MFGDDSGSKARWVTRANNCYDLVSGWFVTGWSFPQIEHTCLRLHERQEQAPLFQFWQISFWAEAVLAVGMALELFKR
jgi:hypothetical protein